MSFFWRARLLYRSNWRVSLILQVGQVEGGCRKYVLNRVVSGVCIPFWRGGLRGNDGVPRWFGLCGVGRRFVYGCALLEPKERTLPFVSLRVKSVRHWFALLIAIRRDFF